MTRRTDCIAFSRLHPIRKIRIMQNERFSINCQLFIHSGQPFSSVNIYTTEYLTNIDLFQDSIYLINQKQEQTFPYHHHLKGQFTYIEGGISYLNTRDKAYFLPARHYIWIPPQLEHFVLHTSSTLKVANIYFTDEDDLKHPFFSKMGIYPVNDLLLEMLIFTERWSQTIRPGGFDYEFLMTLKHLLPEISQHPLPIALPTTHHERLVPVLEYLQRNVSQPLHLPEVAYEFGTSARTLSRLFHQELDMSFLQYVKMYRIIRAIEDLLQTDKSITEIAYDVGYTSLATFSNTFLQMVNRRPAEFRSIKT